MSFLQHEIVNFNYISRIRIEKMSDILNPLLIPIKNNRKFRIPLPFKILFTVSISPRFLIGSTHFIDFLLCHLLPLTIKEVNTMCCLVFFLPLRVNFRLPPPNVFAENNQTIRTSSNIP